MLTIQQIKDTVADYFKDKPVKKVYLFGSYARGEAEEESDVDLLFSLVENTRISYFGLAQFLVDLEDKFNKKVDFVEEKTLYPRLRPMVEADKMLLYSK
jgi:predicted nucleotidyltransferase